MRYSAHVSRQPVLVAKVILVPLAPPASFTTGQFNVFFVFFCVDVSDAIFFFFFESQVVNFVIKVFAFDRYPIHNALVTTVINGIA